MSNISNINMPKLETAYNSIKEKFFGERNKQPFDIEPFESVQLVEKYRHYFKPEKVKIILLAESHVFTEDKHRNIFLKPIKELKNCPDQYAQFVYCLGYGEESMAENYSADINTGGTHQYWKIFYSCCNHPISKINDFAPILKTKTSTEKRIKKKIEILQQLQDDGIWLVDTSIVALYKNIYKNKEKSKQIKRILQESWKSYTRDIVDSANPEHIICIGIDIYKVIKEDLKKWNHSVIEQPNAPIKGDKHFQNLIKCSEICNEFCSTKNR